MNTLRKSFRKSMRRRPAHDVSKSGFLIRITDIGLDFTRLFQPTSIVVTVTRHSKNQQSEPVPWEASLKSPKEGFCFFHPPFETHFEISSGALPNPNQENSKPQDSSSHSHHKDVYISVENVDKKGKRKLLAKNRLDLLHYVGKQSGQAFRLKLLPETKKLAKCYVNITIQDLSLTSSLNNHSRSSDRLSVTKPIQVDDDDALSKSIRREDGSVSSLSNQINTRNASTRSLAGDLDDSRQPQDSNFLRPNQSPEILQSSTESLAADKETHKVNEEKKLEDSSENIRPAPETKPIESKRTPELHQKVPDPSIQKSTVVPKTPPKSEVEKTKRLGLSNTPKVELVPSGNITPLSKTKSKDEEILKWAKDVLKEYTQIKITNLNSSWRNGLGFCALIHTEYPDLIPYETLKAHNGPLNRRLALSASKLIGVDLPNHIEDLSVVADTLMNTKVVTKFLSDLKFVLETKPNSVSDEEIERWQNQWFKDEHLFAEKFTTSSRNSSLVDPSFSFETSFQSVKETSKSETIRDSSFESSETKNSENGEESSPSKNRSRVLDLISEAHSRMSEETSHEETHDQNSLSDYDGLTSVYKELKLLELEMDRITHEQESLEKILRRNSEANVLPRYLQLVNEKNSVVRRQMQLNIKEKMVKIDQRQAALRKEIQQLSNIPDERKTEVQRQHEHELVQEHISLVNEKNELVLNLDNEERAIMDDETIEESLLKHPVGASKEDCVIQ